MCQQGQQRCSAAASMSENADQLNKETFFEHIKNTTVTCGRQVLFQLGKTPPDITEKMLTGT